MDDPGHDHDANPEGNPVPKRQDIVRIARQFIGAIPFSRAVGMELREIGEGWARITMPYSAELVGEPSTGVIHGGAVSALMDTCGGAAVMSHPTGPVSTATIDLRIDYMRAATPGQTITAEATCYHVTRSVAFVRAVARDETGETPVATASGAFTLQRATSGRLGARSSGSVENATQNEEHRSAIP
ncbi:MAG: PaaI family thioesterase [Pseudomonadota bacterium]